MTESSTPPADDAGTRPPLLPWQVIGVVPVTGRGLLSCHAEHSPDGTFSSVFRHDGVDGSRTFAKRVKKVLKKGPVLLCWDAPLTSAEFQRRSIERQARAWVRDLFTDLPSKPAIRSAAARPHWIATQRILGLPVHEGMVIRGSLLQPILLCDSRPPVPTRRELYVTEVHAPLAIGLHPAGRSLPWYRDHLENAWSYYVQAARLWELGTEDLEMPPKQWRLRMHDFVDAWVAMALGTRWLAGSGVDLAGNRKEGTFLLPRLAAAPIPSV